MKNRREHPRRTLIHHLSITDPGTGQTIGFLENISLGGMMALGQHQMKVSADVARPVELQLPTDTSKGGFIPLKVTHTWNGEDKKAGLHATGLEFVDTEISTLKRINALMDELGSKVEDE